MIIRKSAGTKANKSGQKLEDSVYSILRNTGLDYTPHCPLDILSIFNHKIRVDAMVHPCHQFPGGLIVECKRQQSDGTAYEKLPYLVANIKEVYPCPTIIVVSGDAHRNGVMRWLRKQVDGVKLLDVFTYEELMKWTDNL